MRHATPGALLVLAACGLGPNDPFGGASAEVTGIGPRGESSRGEGTTTGTEVVVTTDPQPMSSSEGASGGEDLVETSGAGFDLGAPPEFDALPAGCVERKVDFLFIASRYHTQVTLFPKYLAALPTIYEIMETKFAGYDKHILFANPDGGWGDYCCDEGCDLDAYQGECIDGVCWIPGYPCGAIAETTTCDWTQGAGIVFPAGNLASNHACPLVGGRRYIVGEHPEPAAAFDCLARGGFSGGLALGDALVAALSPEMNGPQGCNAGFLRDDALLVVVMISGNGSHGDKLHPDPRDWYDALMAARGEDLRSVAVLGIVNDVGLPGAKCPGPWQTYATMWKFLDMTAPQSVLHSACEADWAAGFDAATDLVVQACAEAPPS